jgi:hypothetical protein
METRSQPPGTRQSARPRTVLRPSPRSGRDRRGRRHVRDRLSRRCCGGHGRTGENRRNGARGDVASCARKSAYNDAFQFGQIIAPGPLQGLAATIRQTMADNACNPSLHPGGAAVVDGLSALPTPGARPGRDCKTPARRYKGSIL